MRRCHQAAALGCIFLVGCFGPRVPVELLVLLGFRLTQLAGSDVPHGLSVVG